MSGPLQPLRARAPSTVWWIVAVLAWQAMALALPARAATSDTAVLARVSQQLCALSALGVRVAVPDGQTVANASEHCPLCSHLTAPALPVGLTDLRLPTGAIAPAVLAGLAPGLRLAHAQPPVRGPPAVFRTSIVIA